MTEIQIHKLKLIKILYVEDDLSLRTSMKDFLKLYFKEVLTASNGSEGLELFLKYLPDIVLTDIKMPKLDGIKMTMEIKKINRNIPVILTTAYTETEDLINAIEANVDRYIQKPINIDSLLETLYVSALPKIQKLEIAKLRFQYFNEEISFGKTIEIKNVFEKIKNVADTSFSVVLKGETGVGKNFMARAIHDMSGRKNGPFIKIDLGSMVETLIESELFGYEKGAFTDAGKKRKGLFAEADGGTIFLDELENASLHFQAKLLNIVEEKKIIPVGANTPFDVDVRIISATNKNLYDLVKEGKFREDLYYRLAEFEVTIPPLRERKDDIIWFAIRFLSEASDELKKSVYDISSEAKELLKSFKWEGNVRELRNFIRRLVLLSESSTVSKNDVLSAGFHVSFDKSNRMASSENYDFKTIAEMEKELIENTMNYVGGNKTKAARLLGIDITTLRRKIKQIG